MQAATEQAGLLVEEDVAQVSEQQAPLYVMEVSLFVPMPTILHFSPPLEHLLGHPRFFSVFAHKVSHNDMPYQLFTLYKLSGNVLTRQQLLAAPGRVVSRPVLRFLCCL